MLRRLVALNLVASGSHFGHNAVFFDDYPLPDWISGPGVVVVAWLTIAALLLVGYRWMRAGQWGWAAPPVLLYSTASLLGLAHYLYGPPRELSLLANALILFEVAAASVLVVYYAYRLRSARLVARRS